MHLRPAIVALAALLSAVAAANDAAVAPEFLRTQFLAQHAALGKTADLAAHERMARLLALGLGARGLDVEVRPGNAVQNGVGTRFYYVVIRPNDVRHWLNDMARLVKSGSEATLALSTGLVGTGTDASYSPSSHVISLRPEEHSKHLSLDWLFSGSRQKELVIRHEAAHAEQLRLLERGVAPATLPLVLEIRTPQETYTRFQGLVRETYSRFHGTDEYGAYREEAAGAAEQRERALAAFRTRPTPALVEELHDLDRHLAHTRNIIEDFRRMDFDILSHALTGGIVDIRALPPGSGKLVDRTVVLGPAFGRMPVSYLPTSWHEPDSISLSSRQLVDYLRRRGRAVATTGSDPSRDLATVQDALRLARYEIGALAAAMQLLSRPLSK